MQAHWIFNEALIEMYLKVSSLSGNYLDVGHRDR